MSSEKTTSKMRTGVRKDEDGQVSGHGSSHLSHVSCAAGLFQLRRNSLYLPLLAPTFNILGKVS